METGELRADVADLPQLEHLEGRSRTDKGVQAFDMTDAQAFRLPNFYSTKRR
jgi:hypothetical protein